MRVVISLLAVSALAAQPGARELVRQSIANGERSWRESRQYSYMKREVEKNLDAQGRVRSTDVHVYRIIPVNGESFEKHLTRNGAPLAPDERSKQDRELKAREMESAAERAKRLARHKRERAFYAEIPEAFEFRILGEENLPTGPAWVVEASPRPGFQPRTRYGRMFPKMWGKLWIDKRDVQWVKAHAVAADTVTFGYFIARLAKGSHIVLEQTRLPDGTWVPKRIDAKAAARTFLVFDHNFEESITYSDFQRAPAVTAKK